MSKILTRIKSLKEREKICWRMAKVFLENKDAHGIHDMGVELQALQRAIVEVESFIDEMDT
jgi:hypothetical protein